MSGAAYSGVARSPRHHPPRIGDLVIAARGNVYAWWGCLESAIRQARYIDTAYDTTGYSGQDWAVFIPACRSNTAGTMLCRGVRRKVRFYPAGRQALGLEAAS